MSRLDRELEALAGFSPEQLREKWSSIEGFRPPSVPPSLLRRLVAQRLQERRHGVPALIARELGRLAKDGAGVHPVRPRVELTSGTRLVREWNGQTILVEVLDGGFSYGNRTWRSLSEIARHVTGAHWSGPRFFGLTLNA